MTFDEDLVEMRKERATRIRPLTAEPSRHYDGLIDVKFNESTNMATVITVNAAEARAWGEALIRIAEEAEQQK